MEISETGSFDAEIRFYGYTFSDLPESDRTALQGIFVPRPTDSLMITDSVEVHPVVDGTRDLGLRAGLPQDFQYR